MMYCVRVVLPFSTMPVLSILTTGSYQVSIDWLFTGKLTPHTVDLGPSKHITIGLEEVQLRTEPLTSQTASPSI